MLKKSSSSTCSFSISNGPYLLTYGITRSRVKKSTCRQRKLYLYSILFERNSQLEGSHRTSLLEAQTFFGSNYSVNTERRASLDRSMLNVWTKAHAIDFTRQLSSNE